jgi:glycine/D-amino acid oxidase-like deaminating enzyme
LSYQSLTDDELKSLIKAYAKCWLAHDGCWFLAVEEDAGSEAAVKYDTEAWRKFAPIEARRIMEARGLEPGGGLPALAEALKYRMYHVLNPQKLVLSESDLIFEMKGCRVQEARRRKGLADFGCKPVGVVEFSSFAGAVDERIVTACLQCPPDEVGEGEFCKWRFTLK